MDGGEKVGKEKKIRVGGDKKKRWERRGKKSGEKLLLNWPVGSLQALSKLTRQIEKYKTDTYRWTSSADQIKLYLIFKPAGFL